MGRSVNEMVSKEHQEIIQQTNIWQLAGRLIPMVCLGLVFFSYLIGYESVFDGALVLVAILFFSLSVYWWWWSTIKIFQLARLLKNTEDKLDSVSDNIKEIQKEIRSSLEETGSR